MMTDKRPGTALLEAIVALAILSVAGVSALAYGIQASDAVERARATEAELSRASGFLDAVALWPRADLDRHLGARREGPWRLRITRDAPTVYDVVLSDSSGLRLLLDTSLYREAERAGAP